jgi:long-chain fatty acid transport protein
MRYVLNQYAVAVIGAALLVIAGTRSPVHAAAFANGIQSASTGSVATAGSTANAGDASTIYYNPAGMSLLNRPELLSNGAFLDISTRFQNGGTLDPLGNPVRGSSGNKDQNIIIPALFATLPISDRIHAGIGVFSPYGQINTFPSDWVGRYQLQRTALKTIDVDMAASFKVTDSISVGAGIDAQRAHYFRGSALDFGSLCAISVGPAGCSLLGLSPQAADGTLNVDFVNWNAGFNLGLLYNDDDVTHFGLSYRSAIRHNFSGSANFDVPPAAAPLTLGELFKNTSASSSITMPDTVAVGIDHIISDRLTVLSDIDWTHWSRLQQLTLVFSNPAQPVQSQLLNWKDSWRVSFGLIYRLDDDLELRSGIGWDQTPIPASFRTADLPDSDMILTTVGATYRLNDMFSGTIAYFHGFFTRAPVNLAVPGSGLLLGTFQNHSNAVSLDLRTQF